MKIDRAVVKKILIIKPRGIGDVVLSSIIFKNLLQDFPGAKIDYLTEKPSNFLLEPLPYINTVLLLKKNSLKDKLSIFKKIRTNKYDLVFDLYSNPITAQITFLSGALYRLGFPYRGRKFAYNIYGPEERNKYHAADLHLKMLECAGLSHESKTLELGFSGDDISFAENYIFSIRNSGKLLIGVSPSGGWASKKCDPYVFADICDKVIEKLNADILLLWGPGDKTDAEKILELAKQKIIFAPPTTIGQMGTVIKYCDLFIANDSGPMHISTAVNTPTLSLHGPTSPLFQGPYGEQHAWVRNESLDCIECNLLDCTKNHECFTELSTDLVIENIKSLIKKNNLIVK